jgi:ABC-type lipoprotein release transport system permease subunit
MRQAIFISLGLALGIGLVITVTAASSGVKDAQTTVLHALYGTGTDITVTKAPTAGSGAPGSFGFRGQAGTGSRPAAGAKINIDTLRNLGLGTISSSSVTKVSQLSGVAAAAGGLTLTDTKITGTVSDNTGSGGFGGGGSGSLTPISFSVDGADIGTGELGPLSAGKLTSGRTFASSDSNSNVAVLDSSYATQNKLSVGSAITIAKTSFKVIGIVSEPSGQNNSDVYIPLARAQSLSGLKNDVNTIYVAASSAANVNTVSKEISKAVPSATVTNSSDLANEVTGSLSSTSSLASNLGKWLAVAVLAAAFLLASLLTMSAVSRRVREFGTLKALGWRSRRVILQVMGESIVVGIIGGAAGVVLGFAGAGVINAIAPSLSASVGTTTGSATPGGARQFGAGSGPGGGGGGGFRQAAASATHTVAVHLTAPVTVGAIVLAVLLAIAGGLIAGSFGGWRAARLRPAAALAKVT